MMVERLNQNQNQNQDQNYIIAYDLPSENILVLNQPMIKEKVRSIRVQCVYLLHNLGLMVTESVIITSTNNLDQIMETINKVKDHYNRLNEYIRARGINITLDPVIEIIPLTNYQLDRFRVLAERRLRVKIDEAIERLDNLISTIQEVEDEGKRRRIRYRLNSERVEWLNIIEIARRLGINLERDFTTLIDLIDEALREVE